MVSTNSTTSDLQEKGESIPNDQNVLQKHVLFFDRNQDGIVYPWETFQGLRAIGCGVVFSVASALFINISLSQKTRPGKYPSLLFPIDVQNIHLAKHGSDSGVYDHNGRFLHEKFEAIFRKYAHTHPDALTSGELMAMLRANRELKDYTGWLSSWSEWKTLYVLCKDSDGLLQKETMRALYDGSLFEHLEKQRASAKKKASI
ncbi:probable peroxygenase 4 isoform X2 [Manihot esculenta]|uniref:EF-hand domain-containing protein n=1 Tax=Manihot esculenta TaxID=3983 RepID=A0A2C9UGK9_MANES|nr:probable peroxygenase 4 isoform X2 [Manihot esculenta]OAY29286.1 hypothetical protein MANES_15G133300v8 [Manihot esculenta]